MGNFFLRRLREAFDDANIREQHLHSGGAGLESESGIPWGGCPCHVTSSCLAIQNENPKRVTSNPKKAANFSNNLSVRALLGGIDVTVQLP